MPRLLPLLLLCLTLLTAACKKDKTEPEPQLEGRWHKVRDVKSVYDPTGKLLDTYTTGNIEGYAIDFTPTSLQILFINREQYMPAGPAIPFKREGNKLTDKDGYVIQIVTLTDHQLVLFFEKERTETNGNYINNLMSLSR